MRFDQLPASVKRAAWPVMMAIAKQLPQNEINRRREVLKAECEKHGVVTTRLTFKLIEQESQP